MVAMLPEWVAIIRLAPSSAERDASSAKSSRLKKAGTPRVVP